MPLFARAMFGLVNFAARKGLAADEAPHVPASSPPVPRDVAAAGRKRRALETGVRGETFAYWYLRRHGYIIVARNFSARGFKGELDLVGYDGPVLAFIEVKTRAAGDNQLGLPEDAVTPDKRRHLARVARQFLAERRMGQAVCRFDVLALESRPGAPPVVRLHKNAFAADR